MELKHENVVEMEKRVDNHMYTLAVLLSLTHDRYKHALTPTLINPITQTQPRTHTQTHAI